MFIEQTVEIPADHRLTIEVPPEVPAGKVIITFTPDVTELPRHRLTERQRVAIEKCRGIAKGILSSDESLEMRREDFELEEAKYRRLFPLGGGN
jgi:methyl coenzyme M reductase gamma subunit